MRNFLKILVIFSALIIFFISCKNGDISSYHLPTISTEEEFKSIGTYIGEAGKIVINDDRTGRWTPSRNVNIITDSDIDFTWTISTDTISIRGHGIDEDTTKLKLRGNKILVTINETNLGSMILNPLSVNDLKGKSVKLIYPNTENLDEKLKKHGNSWYITSLKFDNDGVTGTANVRTLESNSIKTLPAIGSFDIYDDHITIRGFSSLGGYGFRYSKAKIHDRKLYIDNHDTGRIIYTIQ